MVLSMLLIVVLSNIVILRFLLNAQLQEMRGNLKVIAQTAAVGVDAAKLQVIPLNASGRNTSAFRDIAGFLGQVRDNNSRVRYIYILTKSLREGEWQFVVDVEQKSVAGKAAALPGQKYSASRFPEMLKAWNESSADKDIETDEWGPTLSGYAPIRDLGGRTVGVLGVDVSAGDYYATLRLANERTVWLFIAGVLVSLVVGVLMSIYITVPVEALVVGTRRLGMGDWQYKVPVHRNDEIGLLAASFNKMAGDLDLAREQNQNYFCGVIQALVRVVEAKDPYTRGHSERVAEYAVGIAAKMGLSKQDIHFVRQMAILHDIGKIGIQDDVLNKSGPLTADERKIVNQHPQLGAEIIKPVALTPEMVSIIRSHHEHYNGRGYPDQVQGDAIHLFSRIISVADAYDAMTSTRAYRRALTRDEAMVEIGKNRGQQFDPSVVDALVSLVSDEVHTRA